MWMKCNTYWRLLRFDKPVGIFLLWFPTAWALWVAGKGAPPLFLFFLFAIGTLLMRAAGCVVNDIADRDFDNRVARTKTRPLTLGEVSLREAMGLLFVFLLAALIILIYLPIACVGWAVAAVFLAAIYPLCKRFLSAPQLVLGLAFSMGIPMAFVAQGVELNSQFWMLCAINFLWIVAYDTMYAMTDKEDDLKIGIHSTAIYFGSMDVWIIRALLIVMHSLWLCLGYMLKASPIFYFFWFAASGILLIQSVLISQRSTTQCFKAFRISVYYGTLMWLALALNTDLHVC